MPILGWECRVRDLVISEDNVKFMTKMAFDLEDKKFFVKRLNAYLNDGPKKRFFIVYTFMNGAYCDETYPPNMYPITYHSEICSYLHTTGVF